MEQNIEELRSAFRTWLNQNWSPDRSLMEWRIILADSGWGAPDWPKDYFGMGLSQAEALSLSEELNAMNAIGTAQNVGIRRLAAPTLLEHGNADQKRRFLYPILTGEHYWCQLFSEPGSGSDLASATTRADLDGDEWVINGQKVWTTSAHLADYGLLLARTDWDKPKHEGLSYFLLNMRQPGVEVRQLEQMNGHASFNEVFITDARIPKKDVISNIGDGWQVATTTLAYERRGFSQPRMVDKDVTQNGRIYEEYREELAITSAPYTWYPQRAGRVDLVLERAQETGAVKDPVIRQKIAKLLAMNDSAQWFAARLREAQKSGTSRGPEGSISKLAASNIARQASDVHTSITDIGAMLSGPDSPLEGIISEILLSVPAHSIAGGTDEIQRNIVSERILGMPKEPRFDTGPFRDVKRNPMKGDS